MENAVKEFVKQLRFRQDIQRDAKDPTYNGPFVKDITFYIKIFNKEERIHIKAIKKELMENQNIPKNKIYSSNSSFRDSFIKVVF